MAAITAQTVNQLRQRTGLGLMECKELLKEADGDLAQAETLAKEKGKVKATGRAGRATNAGRVEAAFSPDARTGALIELNCETDFVARNDAFRQTAKELVQHVLESEPQGDLKQQKFQANPSKTIQEVLLELNTKTGENVDLARAARLTVDGPGKVDAYVHHDFKSGAIVAVSCPDDATAQSEAVAQLVKDLALQVVAAKPVCVRREEMPAAAVAEQKRIFMSQAGDKPENIREKIAEGKLNSWYSEAVLLDQLFVKDPAKKVSDIVAEAGKDITVKQFARFVVGETEAEGAE